MKEERTAVLAITMALLLAVAAGPAMAGCQADGAATTTQEGRTNDRGATNAASTHSPGVITTLMAWGHNYEG
jgi:hypothetical protein